MRAGRPADSGVRVVVPYGPRGSSARVRAFDWLDHLGWDATIHDYLGLPVNSPGLVLRTPGRALRAGADLWRLSRRVGRDTVFLVREADPFSRGHVEAALLAGAARGVYDFDDALMVPHPGLVERVFSKAAKWRRSVAAADVVVAGNDLLADAATAAGARDVRLIPSCVEPDTYRRKESFAPSGPPRAVWLGSPATEHYLHAIERPLLEVHHTLGLRLAVISAGDRSLGALDAMVDRVAWTPQANDRLADYDLGLMPLPDDPWTRGKCAYKLLQYGAAGMPMVGSPVGANRAALTAMGGLMADSDDAWRDALTTLATASETTRAELGASARAGVEAHYSFAAWAPAWIDAVGGGRG